MLNRFLTVIAFFYALGVNFSFSQVADFDWGISIQSFGYEYFRSMVVDDEGNVFAVGNFEGVVDFDPGPGVYEIESDYPYDDIFILKLNASGEFQWCKAIESTSYHNIDATSIALDSENNLIITGHFQGTLDFDPGIGEYTVTASIFNEGYLLKLSPEGEFVWVKRFGGDYSVRPTNVVVDESSNIYLTGDFHEWMDADPGPEGYGLYADWYLERGLFIIKLDSDANFVWAGVVGGESDQNRIKDLKVDDSGNVVVGGVFRETADFDPGDDSYEFTATSYENSFILKLSPSGSFVWAKQITGQGTSMNAVDIDAEGSIYTVGSFKDADFDPGVDEYYVESLGETDGFIQKLSADGGFVYAKRFGMEGTNNAYVWDVFLNGMGEPCLVGFFGENIDFDPGPETLEFTATDATDGFILSLSGDGNLLWVKQIRGDHNQYLTNLYIDGDQKIYVMGDLRGDTEFGTELDEFYLEYSGFPQADAFIIKLSGCTTSGVTNHILTCDPSYTWINGETYTESNYTATYQYETDGLCDSLVTLNLTFAHLDNEINVSGITMSSAIEGVEYQWLDCDNDYEEVEGETEASFTPSSDGSYCVRIQQGECVDTSDCITIAGVGIFNDPEALALNIFPNPSNGLINVHVNEISNNSRLMVYSSRGKLIEEILGVESYDKFKFQLSPGTYFIHFVSDERSRMFQFVVL